MEKVIYRNKQNGKFGTLVRENKKFKQFILEVDGENVPYSSATIKRWWEVVSTDEVETVETIKEAPIKEADHKEEITSVSRTEKKTVSTQPKKPSKDETKTPTPKVSSTKSKGPDAEVFSYIENTARKYNYSFILRPQSKQYGNGRWILLGRPRNNKVVCVMEIYVGNKEVRISIADKNVPIGLKTEKFNYRCIDTSNLNAVFNLSISNYSDVDKFLKLL